MKSKLLNSMLHKDRYKGTYNLPYNTLISSKEVSK